MSAARRQTALPRNKAEALKTALFESEVARERFTDLFNFAPAGLLTLNAHGAVVDLNHQASSLLGRSRHAVLGLPFAICLERDSIASFLDHLRRCREDSGPVMSELDIRRPQGSSMPARLLSTHLPWRQHRAAALYLTALFGLTEQKAMENSLRSRDEHLRLALQCANAGVWSIELRHRQMHWSPEFYSLLGLRPETAASEAAFFGVLHPADRVAAEKALAPVLAGERDEFHGDYRVCLSSGDIRWLRMWGRGMRGSHQQPGRITGIGIDITEQKRADALLSKARTLLKLRVKMRTADLEAATATLRQEIADRRLLERQILEISEREQRRIGQDLHDGLGQQITGIIFHAHLLHKHLAGKGADEAAAAAQIVELLDAAKLQARQIARGLQPVDAAPGGLMAGLEHFAKSTSDLYRIDCRFYCPDPVLVEDYNVSTNLFRIAQEAVSNAFRHGRARLIEMHLRRNTRGLSLEITDHGRGLPKRARPKGGLGLRFMQYRAEIMGGTMEVCPRPGGGTIVRCHVPRGAGYKPT